MLNAIPLIHDDTWSRRPMVDHRWLVWCKCGLIFNGPWALIRGRLMEHLKEEHSVPDHCHRAA